MRNDLLDSFVSCGDEPRQRSVAANPTQMVLGDDEARFWRGTLVGDAIIVGSMVLVVIGGATLYALASGCGVVDVLMAAGLPSRLFHVWGFVVPPAATAVVAVSMYGTDDHRVSATLAATLGFAVVAGPMAVQFVAVHYARTTLPLVDASAGAAMNKYRAAAAAPADVRDAEMVGQERGGEQAPSGVAAPAACNVPAETAGNAAPELELTPLGEWMAWCFAPIDGLAWPAEAPLFLLFSGAFLTTRAPLFVVFDQLAVVASCALLGVFQSAYVSPQLCRPASATIVGILLVQLVAGLVWRPFITRFFAVIHAVFTGAGLVMAVVATLAQFGVYETGYARSIVEATNLAQAGAAMLIALAVAFSALFEYLGCGVVTAPAPATPSPPSVAVRAPPAMTPHELAAVADGSAAVLKRSISVGSPTSSGFQSAESDM